MFFFSFLNSLSSPRSLPPLSRHHFRSKFYLQFFFFYIRRLEKSGVCSLLFSCLDFGVVFEIHYRLYSYSMWGNGKTWQSWRMGRSKRRMKSCDRKEFRVVRTCGSQRYAIVSLRSRWFGVCLPSGIGASTWCHMHASHCLKGNSSENRRRQ